MFLVDMDDELPWLSYHHFGNLVGNLTDLIVQEENWQPMIDEIWNCRQVDDYSGKNINKKDFMRSWTHSRTAQHVGARAEAMFSRLVSEMEKCEGVTEALKATDMMAWVRRMSNIRSCATELVLGEILKV